MVFVFDLDDTISETDEFSKDYIAKFFAENNLPFKQIASSSRFAEGYFDWGHDEALAWYLKYGDEMMLNFPVKAGAVEAINALYDAGHKIVIATARANDWHVEPEKITHEWLKKIGLKYHKIYIGRIDKEKICAEEGADVFVDDDFSIIGRTVEYFLSLNHKAKEVENSLNEDEDLTKMGLDAKAGNCPPAEPTPGKACKGKQNKLTRKTAESMPSNGKQAYLMTTNYNKDKTTPAGAIRINSLTELADIYIGQNELKSN